MLLTNNLITSPLSQPLFGAAAGNLDLLDVTGNAISAVATAFALPRNGVFMTEGSVLRCSRFLVSPTTGFSTAVDCTCNIGYHKSTACGFVRCISDSMQSDGCPTGSIVNSSNCSVAPISACVIGTVQGQYYNLESQAFLPLSECASLFQTSPHSYLPAYEVSAPLFNARGTATSDRLCGPCSTCPAGFDASPCTATQNTQCTKAFELSRSAVAGIVIGVLIPLVGLVFSLLYIRYKSRTRELGQTRTYLQLTEKLLGDEREELQLMEQAWTITEADLTFGAKIGAGAFGHVFQGTWG